MIFANSGFAGRFLTACDGCIPGSTAVGQIKPSNGYEGNPSIWEVIYDSNHPGNLSFKNKSTGKLLARCDFCGGGSDASVTAHVSATCILPPEQGGDPDGCPYARWTLVTM